MAWTQERYAQYAMPPEDWVKNHLTLMPEVVTGFVALGQARGWLGDVTPGTEGDAAGLVATVLAVESGPPWVMCWHCQRPWLMQVPTVQPVPGP